MIRIKQVGSKKYDSKPNPSPIFLYRCEKCNKEKEILGYPKVVKCEWEFGKKKRTGIRVERVCICGKKFTTLLSVNQKSCSKKCARIKRTGKPVETGNISNNIIKSSDVSCSNGSFIKENNLSSILSKGLRTSKSSEGSLRGKLLSSVTTAVSA